MYTVWLGIIAALILMTAAMIIGRVWGKFKIGTRISTTLLYSGIVVVVWAFACLVRIAHDEAGLTTSFPWPRLIIGVLMIAFGIYRFSAHKERWYILLGICGVAAVCFSIIDYVM